VTPSLAHNIAEVSDTAIQIDADVDANVISKKIHVNNTSEELESDEVALGIERKDLEVVDGKAVADFEEKESESDDENVVEKDKAVDADDGIVEEDKGKGKEVDNKNVAEVEQEIENEKELQVNGNGKFRVDVPHEKVQRRRPTKVRFDGQSSMSVRTVQILTLTLFNRGYHQLFNCHGA
jgi:hypothetical protein